jgi:malate synthase
MRGIQAMRENRGGEQVSTFHATDAIRLLGEMKERYDEILTPQALEFVAKLQRKFNPERLRLMNLRKERQARIDAGELPDFLPETAHIRTGDWKIGTVPDDLQDRRVEITGPAGDRKMVINAFNSGAKVYMSDFEDANSPTWDNTIGGQLNLGDAIDGTIRYVSPEGKVYELKPKVAVLKVRPRGWHLDEKHVLIDGSPVSASLFDFGLFFFHNAKKLLAKGSGPYFYLPKMESHLEARLWNDVFVFAQDELGIPRGTIKATVLIETILAAFEMDEILYELRDHIVGLNCGRWDYIFSYIKKMRNHPKFILPDRALVTMTVPFMAAYCQLAIKTCHKRRAHCIGGMAAQIPVKNDPKANEEAMQKVRQDKLREANLGHDGTWVAHPGLVPVAMEVFDEVMKEPNQVNKQLKGVFISASDLLQAPEGPITEAGVRMNISVGVQYVEAWLRGSGAVPIYNLMEDAATAEISRAQLWQWIRHPKGILQDGRKLTRELFNELFEDELNRLRQMVGEEAYRQGKFEEAASLFKELTLADQFEEFLTIPAYQYL